MGGARGGGRTAFEQGVLCTTLGRVTGNGCFAGHGDDFRQGSP